MRAQYDRDRAMMLAPASWIRVEGQLGVAARRPGSWMPIWNRGEGLRGRREAEHEQHGEEDCAESFGRHRVPNNRRRRESCGTASKAR